MDHATTATPGNSGTPVADRSPEQAPVMAAAAATAATAVGMSLIRRRSFGAIVLGVLTLGALQLWRRRTAHTA